MGGCISVACVCSVAKFGLSLAWYNGTHGAQPPIYLRQLTAPPRSMFGILANSFCSPYGAEGRGTDVFSSKGRSDCLTKSTPRATEVPILSPWIGPLPACRVDVLGTRSG